jgi:hypothetical protein
VRVDHRFFAAPDLGLNPRSVRDPPAKSFARRVAPFSPYNPRQVAVHKHHGKRGEENPIEQRKAFRPGGAQRINAAVLPQLAPDSSWPVGQSVYLLVVRPRAAAEVPGRPRSSRSHIRPQTLEPRRDRHCQRQTLSRIDARPGVRLGKERRSRAWRRSYPPGTPTPRSPRGSADGAEGTHPPRVRANRVERPTALPAPRRRATVRLRCDRRALSCVPDRSLMSAT